MKIRRVDRSLPRWAIPVWLLCLSALAVATRNFEQGGLSVDGPLYALMARSIARTGEWFYLRGTVPHFIPYADHPHLGIWILALVFKVLPPADWSARIPGMVFYYGFLFLLFRFLRKQNGIQTAIGAVLVLWTFDRFSSYCSNAYLDPGALFFGAASVFFLFDSCAQKKTLLAGLAGLSLAACAMTKGLTVAGFFPALVWIATEAIRKNERGIWKNLGVFIGAAGLLLGGYLLLVRWQVPEMLSTYWFNQWTNRFSRQWNWAALVSWRFWGSLNRDAHYLLFPTAVLSLWRRPTGTDWLPWLLLLGFSVLYAPADRVGVQYWVLLLPWIAWAFAGVLFRGQSWNPRLPLLVSAVFALSVLFLAQFLPVRTHGPEDLALSLLQRKIREGRVNRVVLDLRPGEMDFTLKDKYVWYTDTDVEMVFAGSPIPSSKPETAYVVYYPSEERKNELLQKGWCWKELVSSRAVFLNCPL